MKNKILEIITHSNGKIDFKTIKKLCDLKEYDLTNLLLELKLDGKIMQIGNKYMTIPEDTYIGEIGKSLSGKNYVFYNDTRYQIVSNPYKTLMNDLVTFKFIDDTKVEITSILYRRLPEVTAEVIVKGNKKILECFHPEINLLLEDEDLENLMDGDIILVKLDGCEDSQDVRSHASLIRKIGHRNDPNIDYDNIAINYGFDNYYSEEFLEEVNKIPTKVTEEDLVGRVDFRNEPITTMDGIDTKDMDDAYSIYKLDNGNIRLMVHITDVPYYIKADSLIFKRALEKGTSCYMGSSVYHMIHHFISNGICSLNEGEDRLTKTVIMDFDKNGEIVYYNIVKSVINSKKKTTYEDANKILNGEEVPPGYEPFVESIKLLSENSQRYKNLLIKKYGLINFDSNESKKKYDKFGHLVEIDNTNNNSLAMEAIEFAMIPANYCIANYLYYCGIPSIYRVHDIPNKTKYQDALKTITATGYKIRNMGDYRDSKTIQKILTNIKNLEEYPILNSILIQAMARARYSTVNTGHFALGLDFYTHFTSPIRRLPDLITQMILDMILDENDTLNSINFKKMEKELAEICEKASIMERRADAASKDAAKLDILKSMQDKIGAEYEGIVLETGKRTLIRVNEIDVYICDKSLGNNIVFDSSRKMYYDKETNKYMNVTSRVIVNIEKINLINKTLNVFVKSVTSGKPHKEKDNTKVKIKAKRAASI